MQSKKLPYFQEEDSIVMPMQSKRLEKLSD